MKAISSLTNYFTTEYLRISQIILVLLVTLGMTVAYHYKTFDSFENFMLDQRYRLRPSRTTTPKITIIEAAEDSIQSIGRWPWDREWHATVVKALDDFGAKAVAFDVLFSEESTEEADGLLAGHMKRSGNVYLPVAFSDVRGSNVKGIIESIDRLRDVVKGEGHISITPDADGLLRRIRLKHRYEGRDYLQLGFKMALDELGVNEKDVIFEKERVTIPLAEGDSIKIPLTEEGDFLINWAGTWDEAFNHVSFIDVIVSYTQWLKGQKTRIPIDDFENAICIVGVTATGLFDIRSIPLEPAYPAVGINATVLDTVLQRQFLTVLGGKESLVILWILGGFIFFCSSRFTYFQGTLLIILLALLYTIMAFILFIKGSFIIPVVYPLFLVFFSYLALTIYQQIITTIEKRRLTRLATTDVMTGLTNIGHFKLLLAAELKSVQLRKGKELSVIMVDADHFKMVNDTFGHQSGDEVLKTIAETLKVNSRTLDVPCRYGGEEFILMLPGAGTDNAAKVADKIRKSMESRKFYLGEKKTLHKVTLSLGVSTYKTPETSDDFIKRADTALYKAKETGRNKVCCAP